MPTTSLVTRGSRRACAAVRATALALWLSISACLCESARRYTRRRAGRHRPGPRWRV